MLPLTLASAFTLILAYSTARNISWTPISDYRHACYMQGLHEQVEADLEAERVAAHAAKLRRQDQEQRKVEDTNTRRLRMEADRLHEETHRLREQLRRNCSGHTIRHEGEWFIAKPGIGLRSMFWDTKGNRYTHHIYPNRAKFFDEGDLLRHYFGHTRA